MFRFPCGFSTTHSESLNLQTATQLCYNIHPDTSMHVIILITTYAITQQAHSCSTGLRRNGSTATRPPMLRLVGAKPLAGCGPRPLSLGARDELEPGTIQMSCWQCRFNVYLLLNQPYVSASDSPPVEPQVGTSSVLKKRQKALKGHEHRTKMGMRLMEH